MTGQVHYRAGDPPTTEIPMDGQGKWLIIQESGDRTIIAISGPRGGTRAIVELSRDIAELAASALLRRPVSAVHDHGRQVSPDSPAGESCPPALIDLPCGCQDVYYACGYADHEHDHVVCDRQPADGTEAVLSARIRELSTRAPGPWLKASAHSSTLACKTCGPLPGADDISDWMTLAQEARAHVQDTGHQVAVDSWNGAVYGPAS